MSLLARTREEIFDSPDTFPVAAEQRAADDAGKVDYVGCHQEEAQRDRHSAMRTPP
jgi:hypothetical protein